MWNKLFLKSAIEGHFFEENIVFEDWVFLTTFFKKIDSFALIDVPCYIYRNNHISFIRSAFTNKKVMSYIRGIRIVYETFNKTPKLPFARRRMAIALKMLMNKIYHSQDKEIKKMIYQEVQNLATEGILSMRFWSLKTLFRWLFLNK